MLPPAETGEQPRCAHPVRRSPAPTQPAARQTASTAEPVADGTAFISATPVNTTTNPSNCHATTRSPDRSPKGVMTGRSSSSGRCSFISRRNRAPSTSTTDPATSRTVLPARPAGRGHRNRAIRAPPRKVPAVTATTGQARARAGSPPHRSPNSGAMVSSSRRPRQVSPTHPDPRYTPTEPAAHHHSGPLPDPAAPWVNEAPPTGRSTAAAAARPGVRSARTTPWARYPRRDPSVRIRAEANPRGSGRYRSSAWWSVPVHAYARAWEARADSRASRARSIEGSARNAGGPTAAARSAGTRAASQ